MVYSAFQMWSVLSPLTVFLLRPTPPALYWKVTPNITNRTMAADIENHRENTLLLLQQRSRVLVPIFWNLPYASYARVPSKTTTFVQHSTVPPVPVPRLRFGLSETSLCTIPKPELLGRKLYKRRPSECPVWVAVGVHPFSDQTVYLRNIVDYGT